MHMMASRLRHLPILASFLVLSLRPADASATRLASVVRGAGAGADKGAAFASYFARYYMTEDGRYDVVDLNTVLGVPEIEQASKAFGQADELIQKAMSAYETLDLDPAVDYLGQAVQKFEKNAGFLIDVKDVANALMLLGAVHILRGEEKTGAERLAQALAINPAVEPDPRIFNPSMRQVFQKVADGLGRKAKATLSLTSSPSYAEVYVDGKFYGITPMAVPQLSEGRHFVRLSRDGYKSWGDVVSVVAGREGATNGVLRPIKRAEEYDKAAAAAIDEMRRNADDDDAGAKDAMLGLQRLLGVDQLFLAEVKLEGERISLLAAQYDCKAKQRLKVVRRPFPYDPKADAFDREISDLLRREFGETTLGKRQVIKAAPEEGEGDAEANDGDVVNAHAKGPCYFGMTCQKMKLAALITGAGGGAVLAATGGLLWYFASSNRNSFVVAKQGTPEASSFRSAGKTEAVFGDILFPLGVLTAAAGAAVFFFYHPPVAAASSASGNADVSVGLLPGGASLSATVGF
jgi:hypothetical protein